MTVHDVNVIYVDDSAGSDNNSGASWFAAKKTVMAAANIDSAGADIWVAAGTYKEAGTIYLISDSAGLYGGFSGVENAREQQNWTANLTTLDGSERQVFRGGDQRLYGMRDRWLHDQNGYFFTNSDANCAGGGGICCVDGAGVTLATTSKHAIHRWPGRRRSLRGFLSADDDQLHDFKRRRRGKPRHCFFHGRGRSLHRMVNAFDDRLHDCR